MKWGKVKFECAECKTGMTMKVHYIHDNEYSMASIPGVLAKHFDGRHFTCHKCGKFNIISMEDNIKMKTRVL
jgi:predicted RNA-binding Zn-ribbon protein involved in translation (DUF1610 family)